MQLRAFTITQKTALELIKEIILITTTITMVTMTDITMATMETITDTTVNMKTTIITINTLAMTLS